MFDDNGDLPVTAASNATDLEQQTAGLPNRITNERNIMEFLSTIGAFVTTAAGKAAAGTAIAAASVGGLHATEVVDLPVLPDRPAAEAEDETTDTNEATSEDDAGAEDAEGTEEETTSEDEAGTDDEASTEDAEGAEGEGLGVDGDEVSEDAQDGGVDGGEVSSDAVAGTPAEDRVPDSFGERGNSADRGAGTSGTEESEATEERGSQDPTDGGEETPAPEQTNDDSDDGTVDDSDEADDEDGSEDPTDGGENTPAGNRP